jgi:hypothetical protein
MMNAYRKQGYTECSNTIQNLLAKKVLDRELPIVQAIVDTRRKSKSERNVIFELSLLKTTFNGYPLIQWTTELGMSTEMRQFLIEAGFTPGVTSKISEGPASIISLVIDDRKWAFEDVKFLIRKGHDLNKYDPNSLSFNRHRRSPFFVAVESHRYDIAKFLLLNGAQPLQTSTVYLYYYSTEETLYLLITCNSFLSVPLDEETYSFIFYKSTHNYKNSILLILDKIDIFCYEERKALLYYRYCNNKSGPKEILEKIHTMLHEPDSLMNICRKRLHRHYRCHFHRFIHILIDEAIPKFITDYLQCKDLLLKYFNAEDIEV